MARKKPDKTKQSTGLPAARLRLECDPTSLGFETTATLGAGCTLIFALFVPISVLAARTSQVVLVVFILINLSLSRIKWRRDPAPENTFIVPVIVPFIGLLTCLAMLVGPFLLPT